MSTMRRFLHSLFLTVFTLGALIGPLPASAILKGVAAAPGLQNAASVAITGGTITGTNAPYVLAKWGIPFIKLSTGNIGNNGALTAVTALPRTFSGGAYVFLPIGAIAAGVPAAASWYWCVFSSTTAGTIYNSTYTTGIPTVGVQTAFVTTGPGAFTGDTSEQGVTITIPANAVGANGFIRVTSHWEANNTAGAKSNRIRLGGIGGTAFLSQGLASQNSDYDQRHIVAAGATNLQVGTSAGSPNFGITGVVPVTASVDMTASTTIVFSLQQATATDNHILTYGAVEVMQ